MLEKTTSLLEEIQNYSLYRNLNTALESLDEDIVVEGEEGSVSVRTLLKECRIALFAAVGSAVDSPAEAQQFIFPITIPMLISYFALFTFILDNPHGTISIWLSIIPFTSPIAMMGRIGFGVPPLELAASMICLIGGFIFTTWVAARIYRVGILMHGSKVSYKVLAKWFMMRG